MLLDDACVRHPLRSRSIGGSWMDPSRRGAGGMLVLQTSGPRGGPCSATKLDTSWPQAPASGGHRGKLQCGEGEAWLSSPFWPIPRAIAGIVVADHPKSGVPAERRGASTSRTTRRPEDRRCPRPRRGSAFVADAQPPPVSETGRGRGRGGPAHVRRCGREDRRPRPSGAIRGPAAGR